MGLKAGLNPLGIPEDDTPLFFGDPQGTSSRYFASSDYLLNSWALPAVTAASSTLDQARSAWIAQVNSVVQDQQLSAERDQRIEQLKAKYGDVVMQNCGNDLEAPDGTPLESSTVLDAYGAIPDQLAGCYIRRMCRDMDPDDPQNVSRLEDGVIKENFGKAPAWPLPPIQPKSGGQMEADTPLNQLLWSELCRIRNVPPKDAATRHQVELFNQNLDNDQGPWSLHQVFTLWDGKPYFRIVCGSGVEACAPEDDDSMNEYIPVAALYRPIGDGEFQYAERYDASRQDTYRKRPKFKSKDDLYGFYDIRSDGKAFTAAVALCDASCASPDGPANGPPMNQGKCAHDRPEPKELDASCFRGGLGVAWNEVKRARLSVTLAIQTLQAKQDDLSDNYKTCAQKDAHKDALLGLTSNVDDMKQQYQMAALAGQAMFTLGGAYVTGGASLVTSLPSLFQGGIGTYLSNEEADYQRLAQQFSLQENSRACWDSWKSRRNELRGAMTSINIAQATLDTERVAMQNAIEANVRAMKEGSAVLKREMDRPVGSYAHHYWVDEKVERYKKEFAWAKRLTFLAMRAVEFEFQQSLPLRSQIVSATNPDQLADAVNHLQQEQAGRTINRRRPESSSLVMSLRDDILHVVDRSDAPDGERAWKPADRFKGRLRSNLYTYRDQKGNWLGQAIPFTLVPSGALETRCGERMWRVTATVQGDGLSDKEPGVPVLLLKRNTFESQWCDGKGQGSFEQVASIRSSAELFRPNDMIDISDSQEFTAALLYPWFNIPKTEFFKSTYQDGSSEELAGRGLYGDYVLLFPKEVVEAGFPLDKVEDVLLRIDYLSVDNLAQ